MDDMSFEEYIKQQIKDGYIAEDLTPLKCHKCDSENLEQYNPSYNEFGIVEYSVKCSDCKEHITSWAYGNWNI